LAKFILNAFKDLFNINLKRNSLIGKATKYIKVRIFYS